MINYCTHFSYWIDPNGGPASDAIKARCIFYDDGNVETCIESGMPSENLATYRKPLPGESYWQSHMRVENAIKPPDLHDQNPHTQVNMLRMQHRYASQEIEFFCEGTTIFGGIDYETGEVDISKATSFLAHNERIIDLTKGRSLGASHGFMDEIIFEDSLRRKDLTVQLEYDGCRYRSSGASTKMRIETKAPELLPIIDFTVRDFDEMGRSTLSLEAKSLCFRN
ncbi:unnamed protein product [Schistocephalus solidus]|uniref:Fibrillar collagen NC1 domain-containing protein n=1 Tax=Schistocephalus solidus TaxID=70667 RepID=A0A183SQQ0_SCHSO|nr:unnamed protein product [Schistocephalus solidus]